MRLDTGTTDVDALNRRAWLGITASGLAGIACGAAVPRPASGLAHPARSRRPIAARRRGSRSPA